ncbi:unnamed protein product [Periconia digitata]|uniref:Uncharacterized protein n=1 Tax=Periconia digitata TaxID=1303443 RepID=A0A9W4UQR4_9PLEO|nr:unnamed protein product [Periconia digitata]
MRTTRVYRDIHIHSSGITIPSLLDITSVLQLSIDIHQACSSSEQTSTPHQPTTSRTTTS